MTKWLRIMRPMNLTEARRLENKKTTYLEPRLEKTANKLSSKAWQEPTGLETIALETAV